MVERQTKSIEIGNIVRLSSALISVRAIFFMKLSELSKEETNEELVLYGGYDQRCLYRVCF